MGSRINNMFQASWSIVVSQIFSHSFGLEPSQESWFTNQRCFSCQRFFLCLKLKFGSNFLKGFFYSAIGDVLLQLISFPSLEAQSNNLFIGGLGAFLLAHIIFTISFLADARETRPLSLFLFVLFAWGSFSFLEPHIIENLKVPVLVYCIVSLFLFFVILMSVVSDYLCDDATIICSFEFTIAAIFFRKTCILWRCCLCGLGLHSCSKQVRSPIRRCALHHHVYVLRCSKSHFFERCSVSTGSPAQTTSENRLTKQINLFRLRSAFTNTGLLPLESKLRLFECKNGLIRTFCSDWMFMS